MQSGPRDAQQGKRLTPEYVLERLEEVRRHGWGKLEVVVVKGEIITVNALKSYKTQNA